MALRREMRLPAPVEDMVRPTKMSRKAISIDSTNKMNKLPVELAATTKLALNNTPVTIARATRLCALLVHG